jgi:hypothetical protein
MPRPQTTAVSKSLAHFELRFVKNLDTSSRYAFFMPTVCSCLILPCQQNKGQKLNHKVQTNKAYQQPQLSANQLFGMQFCLYPIQPVTGRRDGIRVTANKNYFK